MFNKYRNREDRLEFCTLAGTSEIGRNSNYISYQGTTLLIDAGLSFPDEEMYGIDYLIPNVKPLKNKNIKGILITHGHLDHIGAIPHILEELKFPPIYAGPFAVALIKEKLKEVGLDRKIKFVEIRGTTKFSIDKIDITYISNTHSIPDSFSIFAETPKGNVFFSGDYKMGEDETDREMLNKISGRVDVALLESTNAYKEGKALAESVVSLTIEDIVKQHKGRVILGAFASLVTRLAAVIQIAKRTGRKVAMSGRSLNTTIGIAIKNKYIDVDESLFVKEYDIKKIPDDKLIILVTGSQGERYAALNRISLNEHKYIKAKEGDLVILSSSEIPENQSQIEKMTDRLIRLGTDIVKNATADVHSSGHGLKEDMKELYEILKPKYIIPIHGSLTFRYQNRKNYISWGHNPDNVLLTDDGQQWFLSGHELKRGIKIESKPILIDGLGVGDIGDIVLKDRRQLASYGMFCIILNIAKGSNRLLGKPRFVSRGFVYMKNSQKLLREIENIVLDTHRNWMYARGGYKDQMVLIAELEKNISRYILKVTEREPIILPVIV